MVALLTPNCTRHLLEDEIHCKYNVCKVWMRFNWDEQKAKSHEQKHGVYFEEARIDFYDENARLIYDPEHSVEEERYILLGISSVFILLIVCHLSQENDELIRIISARQATKQERQQYLFYHEITIVIFTEWEKSLCSKAEKTSNN